MVPVQEQELEESTEVIGFPESFDEGFAQSDVIAQHHSAEPLTIFDYDRYARSIGIG